ncbi:MAG TPA: glycosyl hydrolase family 28-related protein [Acetobacteraceae bacterium]|nr:glycosyl hydrolase family 28-related protein [Acetobacteraceae bacterium]
MNGPPEASAALRALSIPPGNLFNVRSFGATGEGKAIDSAAINRAIAAASQAGGGTIWFPPGNYLSYSIRLRSRIRLHLDEGAVIVAAEPPPHASKQEGYDPPEESIASRFPYQDFGHSHWHNSLIWGENLRDLAIEGEGQIWGRGLVNGDFEPGRPPAARPGVGNKAIALLGCENVILKDIAVREGGHCAVLATGTNNIRTENLRIDTNRDGLNFDGCDTVHVIGCEVNSPNDDAICLKSTYALGRPVPTQNVLIRDCTVTGAYFPGTVMDGTYRHLGNDARTNTEHYTCRIKLGTESNGGFRNIVMRNNVLRGCRGIAIITVDGGIVEDVVIQGLTMHDVRSAPFFVRLGARLRGPENTLPGRLRGLAIRDVYCEQTYSAMPMIVSGIPFHPIEDVEMNHIHVRMRGGGTARMAAIVPPEAVRSYPEPGGHVQCFGAELPASGILARHVRGLAVKNFTLECARPDARPAVWMQDIERGTVFIDNARGVSAHPLFQPIENVRAMKVRAPNVPPERLSRQPRPGRTPAKDPP